MKSITNTAALLLFAALAGCSTYSDQLTPIRSAYYDGGIESSRTLVEQALKKPGANGDVLDLERAMIELSSGRPKEAEQILRQVRNRFDALEESTLKGGAMSYVTDDNRRSYAGEDYERILIRAFLALSNLMHDGGDAEAYSLQVIDKQNQIIEAGKEKDGKNPKVAYDRVAFAPYLRGVLRESTHNSYDDAQRSYEAVAAWQPSFVSVKNDLQRVTYGHHSERGKGVLYVFALVGRGPFKQEVDEIPTTASLLIAGEILGAMGSQTVTPNVATIKVAQVVAQANEVERVGVDISGKPVGSTETVTDVTQLAVKQYQAIYPQIVGRAVARRVVKKGILYATKEASDMTKGSLTSLALDLAGIAWEATENADTRCWGLLPDKIQVLRIELPVGEHDVSVRGIDRRGVAATANLTQKIRIADGRNTYLLTTVPGLRPVGKLLVSEPQ